MQIQNVSSFSFNGKNKPVKEAVDLYSHEFKKASEPMGDIAELLKEEKVQLENIKAQYFPFGNVTEHKNLSKSSAPIEL